MNLKKIILAGMLAISCGSEPAQDFSRELSELKRIAQKISESNDDNIPQEVCDLSRRLQQEVLRVFSDHKWTKYPQGAGNYADSPDLSPVYIPAGEQFRDLDIQGLQCFRKIGQEYPKNVLGCTLYPKKAFDVIPEVSFEIGIPTKDYMGGISVVYDDKISVTASRTFSNLIESDSKGELGTVIMDNEKHRTWISACNYFDKKEFGQRIKDFEVFANSLY